MSQSSFASFDPLATHPFTNNSGLLPKPAQPSQFPHPLPSPLSAANTSALTPAQLQALPQMHAPKPKLPSSTSKSRTSKSGPGASRPIFVPFRPERSSPELDDILLKKKVSDAFANKDTWSIDQAHVPLSNAAPSMTAGQGVKTR